MAGYITLYHILYVIKGIPTQTVCVWFSSTAAFPYEAEMIHDDTKLPFLRYVPTYHIPAVETVVLRRCCVPNRCCIFIHSRFFLSFFLSSLHSRRHHDNSPTVKILNQSEGAKCPSPDDEHLELSP